MERYDHFKTMVNEALGNLELIRSPKNLYEPVSYIISLGGKRLRPVLTLAANELFGGNIRDALPAATGIEIFHNFTLLHDDIMDKAEFRRGKKTVHRKWNSNIAILSGDTMFALAYRQMLLMKPSQNTNEILDTFTSTAIEVCEGQQYDMDFETTGIVSIPEYLEMIRLKTAVLLGCSLKIGALSANAPHDQAQLLYEFGENIGLAFQLKDDHLDAFGNYEKFGKSIGGDIASNKKTYLFLKCLELADENDRKVLLNLYHPENNGGQDKINSVLQIFDKYGVKRHITEEMERYFKRSIKLMAQIKASESGKDKLLNYAQWLFKRDH
jgi:geranylgeranyl diphosphate synthase, type II